MVSGAFPIAMPKDNLPYQNTTFEITGARSHRLVKTEANDILYVVPQGTRPIELVMKVTVKPHSFKKELARATSSTAAQPLPAEVRPYLGPCYSINPRSPVLTKVVAELKGSNSVETAQHPRLDEEEHRVQVAAGQARSTGLQQCR